MYDYRLAENAAQDCQSVLSVDNVSRVVSGSILDDLQHENSKGSGSR